LGSTRPQPSRDMLRVVPWSGISEDSYCHEVRACGIFDAIFVPATKGPAQTQVYPISPGRKLLPGRCGHSPAVQRPPATPKGVALLVFRAPLWGAGRLDVTPVLS